MANKEQKKVQKAPPKSNKQKKEAQREKKAAKKSGVSQFFCSPESVEYYRVSYACNAPRTHIWIRAISPDVILISVLIRYCIERHVISYFQGYGDYGEYGRDILDTPGTMRIEWLL